MLVSISLQTRKMATSSIHLKKKKQNKTTSHTKWLMKLVKNENTDDDDVAESLTLLCCTAGGLSCSMMLSGSQKREKFLFCFAHHGGWTQIEFFSLVFCRFFGLRLCSVWLAVVGCAEMRPVNAVLSQKKKEKRNVTICDISCWNVCKFSYILPGTTARFAAFLFPP